MLSQGLIKQSKCPVGVGKEGGGGAGVTNSRKTVVCVLNFLSLLKQVKVVRVSALNVHILISEVCPICLHNGFIVIYDRCHKVSPNPNP